MTHSKSIVLPALKLFIFSAIGIIFFFVPVTIQNKNTILLDHISTYLKGSLYNISLFFVVLCILYGAVVPFVTGTWRKNLTERIFSILKVFGAIVTGLYLAKMGPEFLFAKDLLPFLFEVLVMSVGLIVPVGAVALTFLLGYGLLEFVGVLAQPIMRPIWKTPGYSAVDAAASFVGSYSVALLITDRVYKEGKYNTREAIIIATGFSTVSAAFMVIVAKTLNILDSWNFYFWSTFVINFAVTAISARMWPITSQDHSKEGLDSVLVAPTRVQQAWNEGIQQARQAPPFLLALWSSLLDGLKMTTIILPSIMAVGLLGLLCAKYTPLFDILGLTLVPFTWLLQMSEPFVAAKSLASGFGEMFLPALLLKDADVVTRYVAATVSVSQVLFLSASIPCILATSIPIRLSTLFFIWYIRVVLSLILTVPVGYLAVYMGWL